MMRCLVAKINFNLLFGSDWCECGKLVFIGFAMTVCLVDRNCIWFCRFIEFCVIGVTDEL